MNRTHVPTSLSMYAEVPPVDQGCLAVWRWRRLWDPGLLTPFTKCYYVLGVVCGPLDASVLFLNTWVRSFVYMVFVPHGWAPGGEGLSTSHLVWLEVSTGPGTREVSACSINDTRSGWRSKTGQNALVLEGGRVVSVQYFYNFKVFFTILCYYFTLS